MMADVYVWAYACTWNWVGFQARENKKSKINEDELRNHHPLFSTQGDVAEAGERHQAERGHRQPLAGRVRGAAVQGPRGLQERSGEATDPDAGRHHHHLLLAPPLRRVQLHLRIHHLPRGEPGKHRQPHRLRWDVVCDGVIRKWSSGWGMGRRQTGHYGCNVLLIFIFSIIALCLLLLMSLSIVAPPAMTHSLSM